MGEILEFRKPKPLKGFIPESPINLAEPIIDPREVVTFDEFVDKIAGMLAAPPKEPA